MTVVTRMKSSKARKTGFLLSAGALFAFLLATPASAGFAQVQPDSGQLSSRINQLENQVQTLSRAVYRGDKSGAAEFNNAVPTGALAGYEERLSQLEDQVRQITGRVEQMTYDLQQMKVRLDKTLADNEMRFQQVEQGGRTVVVPSDAPQSYGSSSSSSGVAELKGDLYTTPSTGGKLLGTMSSSGSGRLDPADALYQDAFSDIRDAKYEMAAGKFETFMKKYPSHALASNAQYWLAETYYVRGDYRQSAKLFAQGYQNYPKGSKASASLLKLGMSLSRMGRKNDACLSFQQLKKEFPGEQTPEIRSANQEMGRLGCSG